MYLQENEFLPNDRVTPTLGGNADTFNGNINQPLKKNEIRLKKMMNEVKPEYPYQDSKLHTFHKPEEKMIRNTNSYSHQNLPREREAFMQYHETHNPEMYRPEFDLAQKRPHDAIEVELEKLNRRKQFSRKFIECSQPSRDRIETVIEGKVRQDKLRHPHKYTIISKELGASDQEIYKMKKQNINFQLQKFTRSKGIQYLNDAKFRTRQNPSLKRSKTDANELPTKLLDTLKKKYPNYIPQVFTNLQPKKRQSPKLHTDEAQPKPPVYIDERAAKLTQLTNKEEMLGKLVLEKVRKHFKNEKTKGIQYYQRVRSEENIDDTLIQLLKTKIDRAEVALK